MPEELYDQCYDRLLRYCLGLAGEPATAEDLAQEAFLRALEHWEDVQALGTAQRRSWLYKTARNLYIDLLRKRSREDPGGEEALEGQSFEEDFTALAVRQLVNRLPPEEKALFELRYFQGYHSTELGELFDLPPPTVRARLSAARRRLARWLALETGTNLK